MTEKVQETVLSNGLKVILLENHKVPEITFQVWYRVGSRNETWGKTGSFPYAGAYDVQGNQESQRGGIHPGR